MKYTKDSIRETLYELNSPAGRIAHRITHWIHSICLVVLLYAVCMGGSLGFGMFMGIIDSAPAIETLHFGPTAFATKTLDRDGNLVATLVKSGSNREKATYDELPQNLVNAFVSIEDERFWQHSGIDMKSILRAVKGVVTGDSSSGGGSTITQQLIKNSVFDGGLHEKPFERYVRKFQEQYLALQLENQPNMTKQQVKESIITDYLNTINLGANTLGVKVAARRYFDKDVSDLTLSECAVIASITKNPSSLNPITHPQENAKRRKQVLDNMLRLGYIEKADYDAALADDVYARIQNVDVQSKDEQAPYSYFTDELIDQVKTALTERLGYTDAQAESAVYSGGLTIYTTQDPRLQAVVDEEINNPDNYDTAKYSIEWRLSIQHSDGSLVHYSEKDLLRYMREILGMSSFNGLFKTETSAQEYIDQYRQMILSPDDTVIAETYTPTLEPQASFVLMDQSTGEVLALSGGRGEKKYSLTLNRASDTKRQPGSTFKVLSSFAPAIDRYGATLASTYYDSEYTIGEKTFKNWYNNKGYLGYQTIRDGIIYSLNIVAVRCMMETLSPEKGVKYAESLGISTLSEKDYNPATALGGLTQGVTNLELTNSYATIANGGMYNEPKFFTKILDQNGDVLLDLSEDEPKRVMKESTAFLLTDAMAESMIFNRAYAGSSGPNVTSTSTRAHFDGMSLAGKSGTTSNNVDIWFVGYSPYYTAGIWGGCDDNQRLSDSGSGEYNGGTSYHKDIWRKIMQRIHEGKSDPGFEKPSDIVEVQVCRKSGKLPIKGVCSNDPRGSAVITEYFARGTEPTDYCDHHERTSGGGVRMILPDGEEDLSTDDSNYAYYRHYSSYDDDYGSGGGNSNDSTVPAPTAGSEQPVPTEPVETEAPTAQGYGPGYATQAPVPEPTDVPEPAGPGV